MTDGSPSRETMTELPFRYAVGLFGVASDFALSGLCDDPRPAAPAQTISICRDRALPSATDWEELPVGPDGAPSWATVQCHRSPDREWIRLWYAYRGRWADVRLRADGAEIRVALARSADEPELARLLEGPVLARALRLMGAGCLHASTLARDGAAIALLGPSGRGKSSLALALVRAGWALVSDDICPLSLDAGVVRAYPARQALRVWPNVAKRLGSDGLAQTLFPSAEEIDKLGVSDGVVHADGPVRLAAVYVLEARDAALTVPLLAPIAPEAMLGILLANINGRLVPGVAARRREFALMAQVAARVPAWTLRMPDDLARLPAAAAALAEHVPA